MPSSPRSAALFVARRLLAADHVAYFAGGCVRDRLRGEEPKDYDVATDATPPRVRELFPNAIGVGESFGVMLVRRSGHSVEVATFRSDGVYGDLRHPDEVRFGDPKADALRRDFTINGLFEDPCSGAIIDYVQGQADLRRGIVRAIGDPIARLEEDRLRCLRAVRFAARFGYLIDPLTRHAIAAAGDLRGVSRERVGQELRRMLNDDSRAVAVAELERMQLDRAVLGEGHLCAPSQRLAALPAGARFETALVAWLLDRAAAEGARRDDATAPRGGAPANALRLARWSAQLVLSGDETARSKAILAHVEDLAAAAAEEGDPQASQGTCGGSPPWTARSVAARKRQAASAGFSEALGIVRASHPSVADAVASDVARLAADGGLAPEPLVSGDDLVRELGLVPGPPFKLLLREVYDAQLEGRVRRRDEAIEFVRVRASGVP